MASEYSRYHPLLSPGIAYSGASFGTLILPVAYAVLIEEYTVRGALLFAGEFDIFQVVCVIKRLYLVHIVGVWNLGHPHL